MKKETRDSADDKDTVRNPFVEEKNHITPRTPVEEIIAGVCASYLNTSPLGIYDNLPDLGFTPQMAARFNLWLQQIFHVSVPVEQLLLCTTIDSLVNLLSEIWGGREIVEEIAWTFLQIEQLSEDEVRSQLADESAKVQAILEAPEQDTND